MELRSVELVARTLNGEKIRYLVVGGLAVNAHGYERFTQDLDLVIGLEPENVERALRALIRIGYNPAIPISPEDFANPGNRAVWHEEKSMLVLKMWSDAHRRTPIDIFIREPFDFELEWQHAVNFPLSEDVSLPVLRYATLLEMKREAGREKDLLDISALQKLDPYRR
jgi:hypothetical protein